jgi:hypothetical protein
MPVLPGSGNAGSSRSSAGLPVGTIPSLTLHMIWTDMQDEFQYEDLSWLYAAPENPVQHAENRPSIAPASPSANSNDCHVSVSSDETQTPQNPGAPAMQESLSESELEPGLQPDSEPELPIHTISKKVG